MPVVRCGDDDGLNVLVVEDATVIRLLLHLAARLLDGGIEVRSVDVADADHIGLLVLAESADQTAAASPCADEADADALGGAEDAAISGRRQGHGTRRAQELTSTRIARHEGRLLKPGFSPLSPEGGGGKEGPAAPGSLLSPGPPCPGGR